MKLLVFGLFIFLSQRAFSGEEVFCQTHWGNKAFKIKGEQVQLLKEGNREILRSFASVQKIEEGKTYKKTIRFENKTYEIYLHKMGHAENSRDLLTITNRKGHKLSYALNCIFNR